MIRRAAAVSVVMAGILACGGASTRGRIDAANALVTKAEQSGAAKCAPKELAIAKAHLHFAQTDLAQAEYTNASSHLDLVEPNAQAAIMLSPAERCGVAPSKPGDRDGDGIADAKDTCPDQAETYNGFQDDDGCPDDPDTDGDGVPDSRDACLLEPEDHDGYMDDDGCPEPDNDLDGIPDAKDKCPNDAEDPDGFEDEDGCPDLDNDGDTVLDVDDMCPNTPGQPGGERPGCPGLVVVTAKEIKITQQIQFDFGKATIKPVSNPILEAVKDVLVANPKVTLEVQGHTDDIGNATVNQKLSEQRADAVKAWLVKAGIDAGRLVSKGFGPSQPLVPNTSVANRAQNRRVQFIRTESSGSP